MSVDAEVRCFSAMATDLVEISGLVLQLNGIDEGTILRIGMIAESVARMTEQLERLMQLAEARHKAH